MSKNEHLVPPQVLDMIERLQQQLSSSNERMVIIQRLEVTRDFIINALAKELRAETSKKKTKTDRNRTKNDNYMD